MSKYISPYVFAGIAGLPVLTIAAAFSEASTMFAVKQQRLEAKTRVREVVSVRQLIWTAVHRQGVATLTAIANYTGHDHTTVLSGIQTCEDLMSNDSDYQQCYIRFTLYLKENYFIKPARYNRQKQTNKTAA